MIDLMMLCSSPPYMQQAGPVDLSAVEALRLERQIIVADCQVSGEGFGRGREPGPSHTTLQIDKKISAGARRRPELPAPGLGLLHARRLGAPQGMEDLLQGVRANPKALHAEGGTGREWSW